MGDGRVTPAPIDGSFREHTKNLALVNPPHPHLPQEPPIFRPQNGKPSNLLLGQPRRNPAISKPLCWRVVRYRAPGAAVWGWGWGRMGELRQGFCRFARGLGAGFRLGGTSSRPLGFGISNFRGLGLFWTVEEAGR